MQAVYSICVCIKLQYRLMVGTFFAATKFNAFVVWEQIVLPHPNTGYGIMHAFQLTARSIDTKK